MMKICIGPSRAKAIYCPKLYVDRCLVPTGQVIETFDYLSLREFGRIIPVTKNIKTAWYRGGQTINI